MRDTESDDGDAILIEGIEVPCALGVSEAERSMRRPVRIDLELGVDLEAAGVSDDLGDTLDYAAVHARVVDVVEGRAHALVEALGRRIFDALFAEFERIDWIAIEIRKPNPLAGVLDFTGCRMMRHRGE
jgi:dihydroneopterin aldolase